MATGVGQNGVERMEQENVKKTLLERRAEKLEEIAEAERDIEHIDGVLRMFCGDEPRIVRTRGRRGPTIQEQVLVESFRILEKEGPMKRNLLLERLVERGVQFGSKNPGKHVGKILANDTRFKTDGRGVWSLAGQDPPVQGRVL